MSASIEQIGEELLHLVGDVERKGLNGGRRVHPARGDEDAAIDDEEILDVVRAAPFIHDGAFGVGAHAFRAEQIPAAPRDRRVDADVARSGGFENLPPARQRMLHHLPAVLADRVVDLWRGNAVAVLQYRIQRDLIVLLRQVLANRRKLEPRTVELAEDAVMIGAPRQDALLLSDDSLEHRPGAANELD